MTVHEMKTILSQKLREEETCFTYKDIHIKARPTNSNELCWDIWVTDYEHIVFELREVLSGEEKGLYIYDKSDEEFIWCDFVDIFKGEEITDRDYKSALISLGYTIGTTF